MVTLLAFHKYRKILSPGSPAIVTRKPVEYKYKKMGDIIEK